MTSRSALRGNDAWTELAALAGLMVVAAVGHVVLLGVLYLAPMFSAMFEGPPPIEDYIEVSLVSLPHTDRDMAQMDVRVQSAPAPVDQDAPDPMDEPGRADDGPTEAQDTPNPSDLAFETPDAQEAEGDPDNQQRDPDRDARKRDLIRQAMLNAAVGTEASEAGDPNSTSSERIDLGGQGIRDPEAARYIEQCKRILYAEFNPLPQLKAQRPAYEAEIVVRFDTDTGIVQSWSWVSRSGNASWDGAAERAVEAVQRLPVPPERVKGLFSKGFKFNFTGED